ncbi:MAG: FG-GAP-like repeat-containing protein, partial [Sporichthyaceae bacterium]|nr:FG-GAP-like repeat-containing protein [Sporichthyaceae bacterium]
MRESSGVAANLSALPGGGAGGSLGDRFQPDLVKGTGNYQIPLHFPYGPNELKPSLALTYSTGLGNGAFGLGWRLNPLRIERRTDRGVPRYDSADEFVLADGGVLVPVGGGRYRPTADTNGWLIRQVGEHWEIRDGTGHTLRLGLSAAGREVDPQSGATFGWCLEEETDPAGNSVTYHWSSDGDVRHLDEIRYSIFRIRVRYEARPDHIRDGRAGFLRVTRRRASAIELRCLRPTTTVLRRYDLGYRLAHNRVSLLESVTLRADRDGEHASMPPLRFHYAELDPDRWEVSEPTASIRPPSIRGAGVQFVDLTGDGLPDLLAMSGGLAHRWENRGGEFTGPFRLDGLPSTISLERGNVGFADLDGNGRVDLFAVDQPLQLAFRADARGGFDPSPLVFGAAPTVGLARPETRLVDADGDGVVDLYATETGHHLWFRHVAGQGFQTPVAIARRGDLDEFPDVSFADQGVHVADLTGDGLTDIVEVRSGLVTYWPSLGHGRWGRRVVMDTPPVLPDGFRPGRLHLVDLDGSGCADVVYVDSSRVLVWFNQSGNGFTEPIEIPIGVTGDGVVEVADVYGDGRPALVWATPPVDPRGAGFHALRFSPGVTPYLMTVVDNGMGGRFEMTYRTSTEMRRLDADDGRSWTGEL